MLQDGSPVQQVSVLMYSIAAQLDLVDLLINVEFCQ